MSSSHALKAVLKGTAGSASHMAPDNVEIILEQVISTTTSIHMDPVIMYMAYPVEVTTPTFGIAVPLSVAKDAPRYTRK